MVEFLFPILGKRYLWLFFFNSHGWTQHCQVQINLKIILKGKVFDKEQAFKICKGAHKIFLFFSFGSHSHHGGGRLLPPDPVEEPHLLLRLAAQPAGGGGAGGGQGAPGAFAWQERRQNPPLCTGCSKGEYSEGSQCGK